jgi:hypothetical protein
MYKKHCDDYVESYHSSHAKGFNGSAANEAFGSRFHWIITPRLRQIGVFEVPKDEYGVVVYHHWRLVEAIASHPVSSVPVAIHAAALHHSPTRDGPPNPSAPSPGMHSSRANCSFVRPAGVLVAHIGAYAHPVMGGYYNTPQESPGKYSSRVKYTSALSGRAAAFASFSS